MILTFGPRPSALAAQQVAALDVMHEFGIDQAVHSAGRLPVARGPSNAARPIRCQRPAAKLPPHLCLPAQAEAPGPGQGLQLMPQPAPLTGAGELSQVE